MDALLHCEETKLEYASTKVTRDNEGKENPVMHACGHDVHITSLMAAADLLQAARNEWKGTWICLFLTWICLFQPDEETLVEPRPWSTMDFTTQKKRYS